MLNNRKIAALALLSVLLTASCASAPEAAMPDLLDNTAVTEPKINAKLVTVPRGDITMISSGGARIEFVNGMPIRFNISEDFSIPATTVVDFHVRQGALVQEGDPLVTVQVDEQSLRAQMEILEIEIKEARNTFTHAQKNRTETLKEYEAKAAAEDNAAKREILQLQRRIYELQSADGVTNAQENLTRKEEQLALYTSLLEPYIVRAPTTGLLNDVQEVRTGYPINAGAYIGTLSTLDVYQIALNARSTEFRLGMPVTFTIDSNVTINGIIGTDPYTDGDYFAANERFVIRADTSFESPEDYVLSVFPVLGTYAEVTDEVILSERHVRKDNVTGVSYVNIPSGSSTQRQIVKVGIYGGGNIHILQGLNDGDSVFE